MGEKNMNHEPTVYVYCRNCNNRIDENKVKCTNIEENERGQDVVTFKCPFCNQETTSLRVNLR
jgi:hypothetical protein